MNQTDQVILDIKTYDRFKNASIKANLVIDRLFDLAALTSSGNGLLFNSDQELSDLLELAYPERYKNKVEDLLSNKVQDS